LVLASQVVVWLGASRAVVYRRLSALVEMGLLSHRRVFHGQPGVFAITNGGLAIAESSLPLPRLDLRTYRHDLGCVWLELQIVRRMASGEVVVSEREMRSRDRRALIDGGHGLFGVELPGVGPAGQPRLHYPDLTILDADSGRRWAVELELTPKGRRRL
jgi:DNA-binding PadR family transcriptional regulator